MTDTGSELLSRRQFLRELGISDSSERRGRRGRGAWPPHVWIGGKLYYRRAAINDWIRQQEATAQCAHQGQADASEAETTAAILQRAKVHADAAPPLSPEQVLQLQSIFANRAGADGP